MIEEIWRSIDGYEGLYEVSNTGLIRSLDRFVGNRNRIKGKILSIKIEKNGYCSVALFKYGKMKRYLVHRLVARAFIPNPDNLPQVNHKNEDKSNNNVDNLEWCSIEYNINYGTRTQKAISTKVKNGYYVPEFVGFGLGYKEYQNKYRSINRDKRKEYMKEYYKNNKQRWKQTH